MVSLAAVSHWMTHVQVQLSLDCGLSGGFHFLVSDI